jgi:hypothetical protein
MIRFGTLSVGRMENAPETRMEPGRWSCVRGIEGSREELPGLRPIAHLGDIHDANANRLVGTGLNAGRCLSDRQPVGAHVALPYDPMSLVVFRDLIGASQSAIATADALVVEMSHDPGDGVLFVGVRRAGRETTGFDAVVARGRHMLNHRECGSSSHEESDVPPGFSVVEAIEGVASGDTRLATRATVEVDLEGELLTGPGWTRRKQGRVPSIPEPILTITRGPRESLDGRQLSLFEQHGVDQAQRTSRSDARAVRDRDGRTFACEAHHAIL